MVGRQCAEVGGNGSLGARDPKSDEHCGERTRRGSARQKSNGHAQRRRTHRCEAVPVVQAKAHSLLKRLRRCCRCDQTNLT
eukprot:772019-Pleurochrysis_carterae.AAC.1